MNPIMFHLPVSLSITNAELGAAKGVTLIIIIIIIKGFIAVIPP